MERRAFASEVRELRRMSAWWREWAAWAGLDDQTVDDGELCLNEAVGNVIQHGGPGKTQPIVITLERTAGSVLITIRDSLRPFNPIAHPPHVPPASLEQTRPGGLGIHLMRVNAAEMDYRRDAGENILTLRFARVPPR